MVLLREIPRTGVFAWSPGTGRPLVATGTRAGAVDADFSDETKLELWDLDLDNTTGDEVELKPLVSITTDSRFYDIAWGPPDSDHPRGIIAGALENGALDLYDAAKLASGASDALIERATKHSGAIKAIQFNPQKPQILATAGAKGELFIYNVEDIQNPFRLGNAAVSRADDIDCLAWNKKVSHILATGGSGGVVTVWDVKTKKASLTLNNNRKPVSAIAWDPTNSTRLLTASPDDNTPVMYLWNLRNSQSPEKTLAGHEAGVLSLSWCQEDPALLLSSGKDNRTLVWNPLTGENYGELQEGTNWAFSTSFNPHNPNLTATAAFDGKITVQTLQNTNNTAEAQAAAAAQSNLDEEDFFASAHPAPQVSSFSLPNAPAWYLKPVGAVFGFGGKVVYFTTDEADQQNAQATSTIHISSFSADEDVAPSTTKFEEKLQAGDVTSICEAHIASAKTDEERADWEVLQTLVDANPRQKVIEHLGFPTTEEEGADTNGVEEDKNEEKDVKEDTAEEDDEATKEGTETADATAAKKKDNRLSSFFGEGDEADDDDFLSGLSSKAEAKTDDTPQDSPGASPAPKATKKPGKPFHLLGQGNTSLEDTITKAIMLGNFSKAVDICLKENRIADAFVVANCGGKELVQKVQTAYLADAQGSPSYLRLLGSVISEDLWDVVQNADLSNWKEALATLCTFATPADFPAFCEGLGDRVLADGSRKDASFCYLVGSKLEKVVQIWISELAESEHAGVNDKSVTASSSFSVHTKTLQQFIEKVTVFRHVTKFVDSDASRTDGWKLAALYDKYIEYADIVASAGLITVAQKYLDLVPTTYTPANLARGRVQQALGKSVATSQKQAKPQAATASSLYPRPNARDTAASRTKTPTSRTSHAYPAPPALSQPSAATSANPYAPTVPVVAAAAAAAAAASASAASNPYAPSASASTPAATAANPYAPPAPSYGQNPYAAAQRQATSAYAPPTGTYGAPTTTSSYGAPPRNTTPAAPPLATYKPQKDVGAWNDVPLVARAPARKNTPSVAPITAPFGSQQPLAGPPPPQASPYARASPTPPPKGPAMARMSSPQLAPPPAVSAVPARPPSSVANTYAPPPPPAGAPTGPQVLPRPPRTESPYNPPPAPAPPSNRYAPSPAPQTQPSSFPPTGPPPPGRTPSANYAATPPPPSSFAPPPRAYGAAPPPLAPPPSASTAVGPPPGGPPAGGAARPGTSGTGVSTPSQTTPQFAAPPRKAARYPPGDRSHIPPHAQRLVQVLENDLQRVAAKAPPAYAAQVKDTNKRLNLLFDHLNNAELIKEDTIHELHNVAEALEDKAYEKAQKLQVDIHRDKPEECGNWMVGLKRLIVMSKATP